MAYWIYEDGHTVGPLEAPEVLDRAKPDTQVSNGNDWVRLDQHPDFAYLVTPDITPEPTPQESTRPTPDGPMYWIHNHDTPIGPLAPAEVIKRSGADTMVSHEDEFLPFRMHPDFSHVNSAMPARRRPRPRPVPAETTETSETTETQRPGPNSPRVRRLRNDYERVTSRFSDWPLIQIEHADGNPPDTYRVWFHIKGLYVSGNGDILERDEHVVEIKLGLQYPRRPPQCKLLTPLFHPNFNNTEVCAQDNYAAAEGLDELIIRIGRMIAYQDYNTKSPLNGIAAKWAAERRTMLPVDGREIAPPAQIESIDTGAREAAHLAATGTETPAS
jgi:ubiquitin-protein ligase